jgi:hypothetical protein
MRVMSDEILFSSYLQCLANCQCGYTEQLPEMFYKIKKDLYYEKQITKYFHW